MSTISEFTQKAAHAFESYANTTTEKRAQFLTDIADNIEALGDALLEQANKETNLPLARLQGERGRTCFQLRMFAAMLLKGEYVDATIDTAIPDKTPAKPDIRKMLYPHLAQWLFLARVIFLLLIQQQGAIQQVP